MNPSQVTSMMSCETAQDEELVGEWRHCGPAAWPWAHDRQRGPVIPVDVRGGPAGCGGCEGDAAVVQLPGTAGCVTAAGTGGERANGVALFDAHGLAESPDGRNVYVAASGYDAIARAPLPEP
jgi:hypothetical protein